MAVDFQNTIDSVGGGGLGGLGGYGNGGILTLLILFGLFGDGFGKNNNAAQAGVLAGEAQAKLDCLARGQQEISQQVAFNRSNDQFAALGAQVTGVSDAIRDQTSLITGQNFDLSRQLSSCCCDLKTGQQRIETAIAMQTNDIVTNATANTQKLADLINKNTIEQKNDRIRELENAAQTATISAVVRDQCGSSNHCGGGVDINLALALARAGGGGGAGVMAQQAQPIPAVA